MQNWNWGESCLHPIDGFHCLPRQNWTRIDFRRVDSVQGSLIEWFEVKFGKWPISSGYIGGRQIPIKNCIHYNLYGFWYLPRQNWTRIDFGGWDLVWRKYQWVLIMVVGGCCGKFEFPTWETRLKIVPKYAEFLHGKGTKTKILSEKSCM